MDIKHYHPDLVLFLFFDIPRDNRLWNLDYNQSDEGEWGETIVERNHNDCQYTKNDCSSCIV